MARHQGILLLLWQMQPAQPISVVVGCSLIVLASYNIVLWHPLYLIQETTLPTMCGVSKTLWILRSANVLIKTFICIGPLLQDDLIRNSPVADPEGSALIKAHHLTLSWSSPFLQLISLEVIVMLSSHLFLSLSSVCFLRGFPHQISICLHCFILATCLACHLVSCISLS
jgi:hypothetical protein